MQSTRIHHTLGYGSVVTSFLFFSSKLENVNTVGIGKQTEHARNICDRFIGC
jgi:hypothetical protein